ncbi:importin beta-like SAD2 homolog isoform X3 [Amaranthus tricolor]|uniref:importin beta-like SAD2 homolog isoform X3 n=1 Tax=Amaranthus tricolor TaxID=29722 RepID=UPI00258F90C6|nr:importin beta-like SAD2 homolog isoform X3 [Amaranthus tricolor]
MADADRIAQLFNETLNSDGQVVRNATQQLDDLSISSNFPFTLLSLINGNGNQGQKVAAATYLKNLIRRNIYGEDQFPSFSKEFKDKLLETLLRVEMPVLRILVEAFGSVVDAEFVKKSAWSELVPQLCFAIQNSDIISGNTNAGFSTVNALKALQALLRPFQYFLNPKVAKESVPPQLEQISKDILVPLLVVFHGFAKKAVMTKGNLNNETENVLLIVSKCTYFSVRSYMPTSLAPLLPSFCGDLCDLLESLGLEESVSSDGSQQMRLKTGKRLLLICSALVTRHRKHSDKLMPHIVKCVLRIVRCSTNISNLDCLSERIISLAFDVISHILETGPQGWRLISPHFSSLLDFAIFPALIMNTKDILEWEEDPDEFISKNLPCDLEEISGWREDLFTARKSASNLLGVISMSKGPPVVTNSHSFMSSLKRKKGEKKRGKEQPCSVGELLVLPFLSKFPIPSDANAFDTDMSNNYYGVLVGYGALHDFLAEKHPDHTAMLIRNRVLPLYTISKTHPYLLAAANWLLGELTSFLSEQDMEAEVYPTLLKALTIPDCENVSCYPVRASAAGAMMKLLDNEYLPSDWLRLLQVVVGRIGSEEEEISMLFQLLSSLVEAGEKEVAVHIPLVVSKLVDGISKYMFSNLEPWPQAVIQGFAALAVMAKSWQDTIPDEYDLSSKWASDQKIMARGFSALLQRAWLAPKEIMDNEETSLQSCIDGASTMFWFILCSSTSSDALLELKVPDLLSVWAEIIAEFHGWEEVEDLTIFDCIKEVVSLEKNLGLPKLFNKAMPSPPAPPVPEKSILDNIATFVCEAISQYPSAASRACACVHSLLHLPHYSDKEEVRHSLIVAFSQAAASRFKEIQSKPCPLWKPLLLAVSSCYLYYPESVQTVLEKVQNGGFLVWVSAVNSISSTSFTPNTSTESELKLVVFTLAKVVEQLLSMGNPSSGLLWDCYCSLLSDFVRLKEIQDDKDEDEEIEDNESEEEEETDDDDDEDSDDDVREETEEEFLKRYAEAAAALENGALTAEEDTDDFDEEPELGSLEEQDPQAILQSLMERYHHILVRNQSLSPQLVLSLQSLFPQYNGFLQ